MNWHLFDRIRAFAKSAGVYQQERIFQDQSSLDRVMAGGEFLDFSQQQALLDQTNLQINRLERYKDYDQMDEFGEMSLALDLYADEGSLVDPERKHVLVIKAESNAVKECLEELFFQQLLVDNLARPMLRYLSKYGDAPFEIVPTAERNGVASLRFFNVYNFTRIETKFGDLVGFFHQDEVSTAPTFLHPWQVMHLRLTDYGNIYHPYGRSVMEGGRKAFKQLRLMEDAALIYRITRAPEKRIFTVPIGNIPAKEVPEFIQRVARIFKNQRFFDPTTGRFNERFSPLIQEDDFFLPERPDGQGPKIETLKGAENLDQIADIEYFKKKMVAPTKIPFGRVGIGDGAGQEQEKSLASSDAQFGKAVQWVQREMAMGFTKVAIAHLAMKGFKLNDIKNFEISMAATNAIDELYRMETWGGRTAVMADLKDLGWFPKDWIVTRFTDLSPDEIRDLDEMMEEERGQLELEQGGLGGGGGLGGLGGGLGEGDLTPEPGAEEVPGIEGEEGGDELAGLEAEAGLEEEPAGLEATLRNVDESQRKVILELARDERKTRMKALLDRATKRREQLTNAFSYHLDNHELDGLQTMKDNNEITLIESNIDAETRKEAVVEYYKLLTDSEDSEDENSELPEMIVE